MVFGAKKTCWLARPQHLQKSHFSPSGFLRTHVVYTRIATARLGVQHQGILQFQSFNPKKGFNTDSHDIFTGYGTKSRRVPDYDIAKFFVRTIGF